MREIIDVPREFISPSIEDVLLLQGIPSSAIINERILAIYHEAFSIYEERLDPRGLIGDIHISDMMEIVSGSEGKGDQPVVSRVIEKSRDLALFVFTLGNAISETITALFGSNEFPLGSMLDSIASAAADRGGEYGESVFLKKLEDAGKREDNTAVLMYSPGYCGWDISGQKKLFRFLDPGSIGVTLNESSLMTPLKSISGVLAAADKEIHYIRDDFDFCRTCKTRNCRERTKRIKKEA